MTPQLALSKEFMESYSRLPRAIQKKVRDFTEKFRQDPTQSGLNFERIEAARDPKVRSARIDQAYRAIVVHPPKGDVYLCVWVDHHDQAYAWARDRQFEINPTVGTFQIYEAVHVSPPAAQKAPAGVEAGSQARLFDTHDDEELLLAGVPQPLLAAVRALRSESDLDTLAPHLPADAAEMLYLLGAGYSLLEAIEEADRTRPEPRRVDVEDFEASLRKPESQQQFRIVESEDVLEKMLDAPLEQWRVFLHPSQRKLARMNANGPVRVLGGAGTGKTVVLMHRANHLASAVFAQDTDRVLVTTFTRNLALDLETNLRTLCDQEVFKRLEITNLHAWAANFMRSHGHPLRIVQEHERGQLFETAVAEAGDDQRPAAFYLSEWEEVVQSQEVTSRDEYLTARRVGRRARLTRKERSEVWRVFERYRQILDERRSIEWPDAIRETRMFIEKNGLSTPYRAVLCDEVQDMGEGELKLLRRLAPPVPNSLFLVGDGHQRIYGQAVSFGACGIDIRGRSRRLKLSYRTTQEIRQRAVAVLEGKDVDDLDGGTDTLQGSFSLRRGPTPIVKCFAREADEASFLVETLKRWLTGVAPERICVAVRTRAQIRSRYLPILEAAGIAAVQVEKDPEAEAGVPGVRIATMHRLKGLEFSRVLLAGVQAGNVPLTPAACGGESEDRERQELQERCLFYVAATRARDELVICGYGEASPFLRVVN